MKYIEKFDETGIKDIALVGGKNASLGEMITQLCTQGIRIPNGFAITSDAYWYYIQSNNLLDAMKSIMSELTDVSDTVTLQRVGYQMRKIIEKGTIPNDLAQEIQEAYYTLSQEYYVKACDVAVRSSATAEDLPTASFAGQQDTFLNVHGSDQLLIFYKKCLASLFTDRAIVYRIENNFDHFKVALSVGVQKMIRSDKAVSGVAFSLDPETSFRNIVTIESSYGLGEAIVQGLVTPDEFVVHKPTLLQGFKSIIKKICGEKKIKIVYAGNKLTKTVAVKKEEQNVFSLTDDEIIELSNFVVAIEDYYSAVKGSWSPMDIEWAKDAADGLLYIIQARPETIAIKKRVSFFLTYTLKEKQKPVVISTGLSIGQKIVSGTVRIVKNASDIASIKQNDILVTEMTEPDWVPVMKKAAGIITDKGGRTCHAAIVSRELGIPAIVGTKNAAKTLHTGDVVTLDCSQGADGYVYQGAIAFEENIISLDQLSHKKSTTSVMINCADPATAFRNAFLPVAGVGLARIEFIISTMVRIHPMALIHPEKVSDKKIQKQIDAITGAHQDKKEFFVKTLGQGVGTIAAAFYPRPVIVRFSDFKSNEYRNLLGGNYFELVEENPMIGFRGASRYYNERYKEAFALECAAIDYARTTMGLTNIKVMIPFVRTIQEAKKVIEMMNDNGLVRGKNDLHYVMMCEVPSNVLLIEQFSELFDDFSIGSNDLTQLVLGVDRDSSLLSQLFDERDEAVKVMMRMAIEGAHKKGRYIGICGQAPSDYPEIADFLINNKIDSLSLNIDSAISFLMQ